MEDFKTIRLMFLDLHFHDYLSTHWMPCPSATAFERNCGEKSAIRGAGRVPAETIPKLLRTRASRPPAVLKDRHTYTARQWPESIELN